jgi:hypothetical protein
MVPEARPPAGRAFGEEADMAGNPARWVLDAGLAAGLAAALAIVAAVEPKPAPPVLETVAGGALPPGEVEIPPLPPLSISFDSGFDDKTLPELPPPPPAPDPPPPDEIAAPVQFEEKLDKTLLLNWGSSNERRTLGFVRMGATEKDDIRLTFSPYGHTNHTAVRVDSKPMVAYWSRFGKIIKDLGKGTAGDGVDPNKLKGDAKIAVEKIDGTYSVEWEFGGVRFEQRLLDEAGSSSRRMDTFRVRYVLTNVDKVSHKASLRLMLDTYIGSNDGVPFFIPGQKEIITKPTTFTGQAVPDYILALERSDLNDPSMTIVQIGFVPAAGSNAVRPDKVSLTQWPGNLVYAGQNRDNPDAAVEYLDHTWEYPLAKSFAIRRPGAANAEGDSALAIFWSSIEIPAGQQRVLEFTYGLGSLSGTAKPDAAFRLTAFGPFAPGQPFTVSMLVKNARPDQKATLTLPPGLTWGKNQTAEKPIEVQPGSDLSKVDWLVVPDPDFHGEAKLTAALSGVAKTETHTIRVHNPKPTLLPPDVSKKPVPAAGGVVRITAPVTSAKAGGTVTLELPPGAKLEPGFTAEQRVKEGPVDQPTWLVRLGPDAKGRLPFTVRMKNPDASRSGEIVIPPTVPKLQQVVVSGLPQSGSRLRVTAQIANADDGGRVEIKLPDGLELEGKEERTKPTPAGRQTQVSWIVRAKPNHTGSSTIRVRLTPQGTEESKTVDVAAATPTLIVRAASDAPAKPGKPMWIVARLFNSSDAATATLTLPEGFSLAGGAKPDAVMESKTSDGATYRQAAWPVVLDNYSSPSVEFTVKTPGVAGQKLEVKCERGSVIR